MYNRTAVRGNLLTKAGSNLLTKTGTTPYKGPDEAITRKRRGETGQFYYGGVFSR